MSEIRVIITAGAMAIFVAAPAAAAGDGSGERNSEIQRSIYDVVRGAPYYSSPGYGYSKPMMQGRSAVVGPPPNTEPVEPEPEYFREETPNYETQK